MPSVANVLGLLERIESTHIAINRNLCVTSRNRNAACAKCAEACATAAMSIEGNVPTISSDACIGCGACANACPTNALEVTDPSDAELLGRCLDAAQMASGEVVIACNQMLDAANGLYDPAKVTGVTCLSRIDESLMLSLVASDDARKVTLVKGRCSECAYAHGMEIAESACGTANLLLDVWGSPARIALASKLPGKTRLLQAAEYDHARREFFSDLRKGTKDITVASADYAMKEALGVEEPEQQRIKVDERGVLPQEFPERRKRLLDALDKMGQPTDVELETRLWGNIDVDASRCSSCRMCATFCPTGAIFKFSTKKGKIGIKHRARQCMNCGCCEAICRTGALSLTSAVSASDITSAEVSRFVMPPLDNPPSNSQSILKAMRKVLAYDQVYER